MNYNDDTTSLCYWRYYCGAGCEDMSEDQIAEWEYEKERAEFLSDWEEYING